MMSLRRLLLRRPRMRRRRMIALFLVGAVIFFTYQLGFMSELSLDSKSRNKRGSFLREESGSQPKGATSKPAGAQLNPSIAEKTAPESRTSGTVFVCKKSKRLIASDKVNDDYCDCPEDGSDEFWTDACDNAIFVCKRTKRGFPSSIVSAWVNDGVCDCCDGSDEWLEKSVITSLAQDFQRKIHRYVAPCPDLC